MKLIVTVNVHIDEDSWTDHYGTAPGKLRTEVLDIVPAEIRSAVEKAGHEYTFDGTDITTKVNPDSLIGRSVRLANTEDGPELDGEIVAVLDDNAEQVTVSWAVDHGEMHTDELFDDLREV